jgi:hypothetical protein
MENYLAENGLDPSLVSNPSNLRNMMLDTNTLFSAKRKPYQGEGDSQKNFFSTSAEAINYEKQQYKHHALLICKFKTSKHAEKIAEVVLENMQEEGVEEESKLEGLPLQKIPKVMKDLAYLCGFIFLTMDQFISQNGDSKDKRSSP